jgi:hypothetical protein
MRLRVEGGSGGEDSVEKIACASPVVTFSRCQAGSITVAMGADDFIESIATVIFIATKGHNSDNMILKFSPTSPTRTHAQQLLNIR